MVTLAKASSADVGHFVSLGKEMHQEGAFGFLPFNEKKCREGALNHIRDRNSCAFLVFSNAECIGMHLGSLTQYFFCDALLAAGLVTYVRPQFRGGRAALLLIRTFIDWGKERHAAEVYIGVSLGVNVSNSHKFFKHCGFRHVGGNYKLSLI